MLFSKLFSTFLRLWQWVWSCCLFKALRKFYVSPFVLHFNFFFELVAGEIVVFEVDYFCSFKFLLTITAVVSFGKSLSA